VSSGDLSEVLGELAAQLPRPHLNAWVRVLREAPEPDAIVAARLIEARPGYALAAKATRLTNAWREASPVPSGAALALALEAAASVHDRHSAERSDVVISGPTTDSTTLRLTSSVITGLIRDASKSLLVVSFAAFGVTEVVRELMQAGVRGVHIDLVLESTAAQGGTLHGGVEASAAFAAIREYVNFWIWPAEHRPVINGSRAALHAKLIAADKRVALVGSANLTDKALAANLELGVILRDPATVGQITHHFQWLMSPAAKMLISHQPSR
jgi:putative cardiolipin synthase